MRLSPAFRFAFILIFPDYVSDGRLTLAQVFLSLYSFHTLKKNNKKISGLPRREHRAEMRAERGSSENIIHD